MIGKVGVASAAVVALVCAGDALSRERHAPAPAPVQPEQHAGFPWTAATIAVVAVLAVVAAAVVAWRWWQGRGMGRIVATVPEQLALPAAPQRALEAGSAPIEQVIVGW